MKGQALVDLVLINGGINDVGVPRILDISKDKKDLAKETTASCARMKCVLESIAAAFPNARIVVTGYYPIVSSNTPREGLPGLMAAAFGGIKHVEISEALKVVLSHKNPISWINDKFFKRWVELSEVWNDASSRSFREIVETFNSETVFSCLPEPSSSAPTSLAALPGNRAFFAYVDFRPEHCYGADEMLLWQIQREANNNQAVFNLVSNDPLFSSRQATCGKAGDAETCNFKGQSGQKLVTCRLAGAGHPNKEGAVRYAEGDQETARFGLESNWLDPELSRSFSPGVCGNPRSQTSSFRDRLSGRLPPSGATSLLSLISVHCIPVQQTV